VVNTDGKSVANLTVTGTLYVIANNVTVTNVQAAGLAFNQSPGGNYASPVKDSMTVSHVTTGGVTNVGGTHITLTDSRIGAGQKGTAIQLSNNGTAMPCDYVDLERNVIAGLSSIPANSGVHSEAIHFLGVRHSILRDNVLDWTAPDAGTWSQVTGVIVLQNAGGAVITDAVIDHNDIAGGSWYAMYMGGVANVLTNNTFHVTDSRTSPVYPLAPGDSLSRSGNWWNAVSIG